MMTIADLHKQVLASMRKMNTNTRKMQDDINEIDWRFRDLQIRHQLAGFKSKVMFSREEILEHYINDKTKFVDTFTWIPRRCLISRRWMWLKKCQKLLHYKSYVHREDYPGNYSIKDIHTILYVHPHELLMYKLKE